MQDALNGEQRLYMEKLARDRAEIQRSKEQLLEDQRITLHGIHESRSQLAEERAKVEALQKNFQEQKHRDMIQNATVSRFSSLMMIKICSFRLKPKFVHNKN